jgi:hypothetical protein
MNCTVCGLEFRFGPGNDHARCKEIQKNTKTRDQRIDAMLAWFETNIVNKRTLSTHELPELD